MTAQILSEQQRRLNNLATIGTVFDVRPDDQTMRLQVGDNQTDWLPIPAIFAGKVSVWRCPSIGEQFLLISPSGELANAIPVLSLYSNQHPSPSHDPNEIRVRYNDSDFLSIKTADSGLTLKINDVLFDVSQTTLIGNFTVQGNANINGNLQVDGSIHSGGDTVAGSVSLQSHKHGGVKSGESRTGSPS